MNIFIGILTNLTSPEIEPPCWVHGHAAASPILPFNGADIIEVAVNMTTASYKQQKGLSENSENLIAKLFPQLIEAVFALAKKNSGEINNKDIIVLSKRQRFFIQNQGTNIYLCNEAATLKNEVVYKSVFLASYDQINHLAQTTHSDTPYPRHYEWQAVPGHNPRSDFHSLLPPNQYPQQLVSDARPVQHPSDNHPYYTHLASINNLVQTNHSDTSHPLHQEQQTIHRHNFGSDFYNPPSPNWQHPQQFVFDVRPAQQSPAPAHHPCYTSDSSAHQNQLRQPPTQTQQSVINLDDIARKIASGSSSYLCTTIRQSIAELSGNTASSIKKFVAYFVSLPNQQSLIRAIRGSNEFNIIFPPLVISLISLLNLKDEHLCDIEFFKSLGPAGSCLFIRKYSNGNNLSIS